VVNFWAWGYNDSGSWYTAGRAYPEYTESELCKTTYMRIYDYAHGHNAGWIRYMHTELMPGTSSFYLVSSPDPNNRYRNGGIVGAMALSDLSGCPWYGIHVHSHNAAVNNHPIVSRDNVCTTAPPAFFPCQPGTGWYDGRNSGHWERFISWNF